MSQDPVRRDWVPVAAAWENNPDDKDIWRRVVALPSTALNRVEFELLGPVGGHSVCVLGTGDGLASLALASMGARVLVVDPSQSLLDLLMVRSQLVGLELRYLQAELVNLSGVETELYEVCYAAQAGCQLPDLYRFYAAVHAILAPGGRLIVNEYHPFRRIWRPEPGSPRIAFPYSQRRYERIASDRTTPVAFGTELAEYLYHWTVSDHFTFLSRAGFRVTALEEIGEVRQQWEVANLRGLPEQMIIGATKAG